MQEQMDNMQQKEEARHKRSDRAVDGEYIDYEEVK